MKLAVIGSRIITDEAFVFGSLDDWMIAYTPKSLVILAGGAKGVDELARKWAESKGVDFVLFKPYFMLDSSCDYNVRHYAIRNKQLVHNADHVLAIWDGVSSGTLGGIQMAKLNHKPLTLITL